MTDNWENKILTWTRDIPVAPIVLVIASIATILVRKWMNNPWKKEEGWATELSKSKVSGSDKGSQAPSAPLKNIWDERKKNGSTTADSRVQKTDADGKPFGSSYYYAHNSLRKTGGYTDGLRMEDYQMETPRLLSKNGISYTEKGSPSGGSCKSSMTNTGSQKNITTRKERVSFIPINKYLWDDPGDSKRIGTIRVEQLTDNLSWKDAAISDIQIDVKDKICLTVLVNTEDGKIYRLRIPELYGEVNEVRKVRKANRLLLRLYKESENERGKKSANNLQAWP
eukprot:CAMPEP_0194251968 /NCGR_PEP_ID=MMETSP0158-20130606/26569_1 /TAXON_ID=33649 /ORGANISM="Thalassionema nitzschioides, Strain L26-B" /LENGTH=281 /DNA_ID=CAMNT_0038989257 /DNA_START=30 /DNA_END=872 /DNA_ORIENTATION=-